MIDNAGLRRGHEAFEHTADVGVHAWGARLTELFEEAAAGLIEVMLDPASVQQRESVSVSAEGLEPEGLLVAWLEEVLFAFDARGFAPATAKVTALDQGRVEGTLAGEPFDRSRHRPRSEVKAVTYHDLAVEKTQRGYEASVIFDL